MQPGLFRNRRHAGHLLARKLAHYADRPDVLVLALPRTDSAQREIDARCCATELKEIARIDALAEMT